MENLDKALNAIGISVASEIKKLAKRDKFEASGDLDKSITYRVEGNTVTVEGNRYIGAISGGINKKKFPNVDRIKQWAKNRGIQPRNKKGRFVARTDANMNSLAFVIGKSISERGISKRFGYNGSGFLEEMEKNVVKNVTDMIAEAYKLDIIVKLKEI
jgi:flagellar basal body rod protein FlgF